MRIERVVVNASPLRTVPFAAGDFRPYATLSLRDGLNKISNPPALPACHYSKSWQLT